MTDAAGDPSEDRLIIKTTGRTYKLTLSSGPDRARQAMAIAGVSLA